MLLNTAKSYDNIAISLHIIYFLNADSVLCLISHQDYFFNIDSVFRPSQEHSKIDAKHRISYAPPTQPLAPPINIIICRFLTDIKWHVLTILDYIV